MSSQPMWLPQLFSVEPWCDAVVEGLYAIFDNDFRQSKPVFEEKEICYFADMRPDGKEVIFWHLITTENATMSARIPDPKRAARLPWVRCLIENCTQNGVLFWDYREHDGTTKTYIWCTTGDFLILFKKLNNGRRRLLTSFYIEYESYKSKLQKKYQKRIINQRPTTSVDPTPSTHGG